MTDLLPGQRVRIRESKHVDLYSLQEGVITWASDAHGADRIYDVEFDDLNLASSTFVASEVIELTE